MQLTLHFSEDEMACPCCGKCDMDETFMEALESFRVHFQIPLKINSGFRCPKHNAELRDSSPTSAHLRGRAADISWDEFPAAKKFDLLDIAVGTFHGIGIGKTYLHVDLGALHKVWVY